MWAACPLTSVSGDALGYWHAKAGHDVDDLAAGGGFSLLHRQFPGVKAAADHGLVAHHRHLAQGSTAVVHCLLPTEPTKTCPIPHPDYDAGRPLEQGMVVSI